MPDTTHRSLTPPPTRIEPEHRLVVLARTLRVSDPKAEAALKAGILKSERIGETCLGQALYRHRSVFQSASDAPTWRHLELSYFRDLVSAEVVQALVLDRQSNGVHLLRAEVLLTTPSSFILPCGWPGSADRPGRTASLEYIRVRPEHCRAYRHAMRDHCGPAAAKLVQENRFGTFRAMETAAVLFRAPDMTIDWNQIHLCELDPHGFDGFGKAFAAALRVDSPGGVDLPDPFAELGRMRTVPRWTFNDVVVASDGGIGGAV